MACEEMKKFIPEIETAVVKYAISRYAARCVPLSKTEPLIREAAKRATMKAREEKILPYKYDGPKEVSVDLKTPYRAKVIAELTNSRLENTKTIIYKAADAMEVYRFLRLVLYLSLSSILP